MQIARRERGAGKVGTIIGLLILISAIIFAWGFIPVRIKVYQLKDSSELLVRKLGTGQTKPEVVRDAILKEAESLELPVKEQNVRVFDDHRSWYVELKYSVPLDFIVYKHDWVVDQKVEGPKIDM